MYICYLNIDAINFCNDYFNNMLKATMTYFKNILSCTQWVYPFFKQLINYTQIFNETKRNWKYKMVRFIFKKIIISN